ncbi:type IV toxin-antitoxin system AbiEi family antitoxin domain-containing protein [Leifsonia sp. F6_8S_P_1B]|uniref:Type IV toxin-antitoxin system AbiEi family antitoxin domain-containing protein n=1 Tax=Leifsonia williamsii TaxID=3035919 RepID=A0ABT8KBH5_9MICO|nr:type IV toxin-antitoxin system AbiEi family antitoxin domain-containing protein [Leifsonia williamsii]MDN4614392.1 type IV toxin-antitoxin system AbiEi family antitoxin domain-containing protein [Leifsonia williamsii]
MVCTQVLERYGGIATAAQLAAAGATPRALTALVREGHAIRLRRGVYALPGALPSAVEAARAGGRLSCVSAARSFGLWGGTDARLHLRVPAHATRLPASEAVRHWVDDEGSDECWRVSFDECLRSVVRCADEETAVAVLDTALSSGAATLVGLRRVFASEPARSRHVASLARPGSDSGVESLVRQRLEAAGHIVAQQVHVPGVGRVDMLVDGVLFLELDGFAYHGDRRAFERDRARDVGLALSGRRRLRLSAAQVMNEWESALAAIEGVLAAPEVRA